MRGSHVALISGLALAICLGHPAVVSAQPDYEKAKEHYIDAEKAMKTGQFELAAREYAIAYEITKDPVLFYKIGTANEKAGDCEAALVYYGRYLREAKPDAELRKTTEERIAYCNAKTGKTGGGTSPTTGSSVTTGTTTGTGATAGTGSTTGPGTGATDTGGGATTGTTEPAAGGALAPDFGDDDDDVATPAPGEGGPTFVDEEASWTKTAGWVSVGASVAFLTAGAVLALSADSREEDVQNLIDFRDPEGQPATYSGNTRSRYEDLVDEGDSFNTYSTIAFAAAGVAAATAVTFFVLDATSGGSAEAATAFHPVVGPSTVGFAAGWEF
jgi:hypothetical protein